MKVSVSITSRRPNQSRHLAKRIAELPGNHFVPIRELLSESFLSRVGCTSASLLHDRLSTIDEEDKAALDDLATHFTSMPTFGQLIGHATADWVLAKLKQKGIDGNAKVTTKAALPSPSAKPPATSEPLSDTTKDQSPAETKPDTPLASNTPEDASQKTPTSNDALIFERLQKLDPLAFEFAQEKKIRLIPRPKWSWAFEWMRTTFDVEQRTDSSGTYYAFLYSPSLTDYQKLTYLISTIRADNGFKEWLEAREIIETKPSTITPAPGTKEYADQQDALMAERGATPAEINSRRWHEFGNEMIGPQGFAWEIPNALGSIFQIAKSGRHGSPQKGYGGRILNWLRRLVSTPPLSQIQINKKIGDAARDKIAAREGPAALIEQFFKTIGGERWVDVLINRGGKITAIESKVGLTSLTQRIKQEIAGDRELLRDGRVDHVVWEFSPSPITGKVGPNGPLRKVLEELGFEIRINP